jgi:hypothetical protein
MKKRETAAMSIAFLDILSGALGAVIILFISVPKIKIPKQNEKDKIRQPAAIWSHTDRETKTKESDFDAMFNQKEEVLRQVGELKKKVKALEDQNTSLVEEKKELEESRVSKNPGKGYKGQEQGIPVDVGFNFKGKNVLFVIDVSGSMAFEDRIGQVKAGLKMLITSMPADYHVNVVSFPSRQKSYNKLWTYLKPMNSKNKSKVYDYLYKLRPFGWTPTRITLQHALTYYDDLSDIVLLSDGSPTLRKSNHIDDIDEIIKEVKANNYSDSIQINTIGVGRDFLSNKDNDHYRFLKTLSKDHNGFFYGF